LDGLLDAAGDLLKGRGDAGDAPVQQLAQRGERRCGGLEVAALAHIEAARWSSASRTASTHAWPAGRATAVTAAPVRPAKRCQVW
jgi:hypothetical protein